MSEQRPDSYREHTYSDAYTVKGGFNQRTHATEADKRLRIDEDYFSELNSLYSNVLDASGMNILDPYIAYLTHFDKLQKRYVDPPYAGKTYIFMTRPDLNFWELNSGVRNVEYVDLFNYFSKTNIGMTVMPWLMYPNFTYLNIVRSFTPRARIGRMSLLNSANPKNMSENYFRYNAYTPFIPMVSNLCTQSSGAKDLALETEITEGDFHGNKLQYAKGLDDVFEPGEISLDFIDMHGSPILHLMNIWVNYIHYLTKGIVATWGQYVKWRILDYTSSIYIFMTDRDNETILRWAKWTGCFPKGVPLSTIQHNINIQPDVFKDLSIQMAYNRYEPMRPAVLTDFNTLMNKFIFQSKAESKSWIMNQGVAPTKLISPDIDPVEIISSHPELRGPLHIEGNDLVLNNSNYYQNKFWGTLPYIIDHKLKWIDPNKLWKDNGKEFQETAKKGVFESNIFDEANMLTPADKNMIKNIRGMDDALYV